MFFKSIRYIIKEKIFFLLEFIKLIFVILNLLFIFIVCKMCRLILMCRIIYIIIYDIRIVVNKIVKILVINYMFVIYFEIKIFKY